jgi:hypothetical protein
MKRSLTTVVVLSLILLIVGCTQKRGSIYLDTRPPGAAVYLDNVKKGETPLTFEWDAKIPSTLRIEKEGYYTETEQLNKLWLKKENYKGDYQKGYEAQGDTSARVWKVRTFRDLREKPIKPTVE